MRARRTAAASFAVVAVLFVVVAYDCLYVLGGEGNARARDGMFDAVERFDPVAGTWTRLAPMALPRHGAGVVALEGALMVVGGAVVAGFGAVPVVDTFVPPACRWSRIRTPPQRSVHARWWSMPHARRRTPRPATLA